MIKWIPPFSLSLSVLSDPHPPSEELNKETGSQQKAEMINNDPRIFPVSPLRAFVENTVLIYLRETKIFLPRIWTLITNAIFIYFHVPLREAFEERHNNTEFALKVDIMFLSLPQLQEVFLRLCW